MISQSNYSFRRSEKPKLLVVGHKRHGKDTVCDQLTKEFGLSFESSSKTCLRIFILEKLRGKYGYENLEDAYAHCHSSDEIRAEWFNLIAAYNAEDGARLGKQIFSEFDIYCGLRNHVEFFAMQNQKVFDYSIWVDRSEVLPPEPSTSMTIKREWTDYEIDNNGTTEQLAHNVRKLMAEIL